MPSERIQRRIDSFLDEADTAAAESDWELARRRAEEVLALDPGNEDAQSYLQAAERILGSDDGADVEPAAPRSPAAQAPAAAPQPLTPSSFASGRYEVRRFLGEGGKKRVYLAHDSLLDRDVAFALIRTEGLDETDRERVRREAQALARLGGHPHLVTIHDIGDEQGQPFSVMEYTAGGSVADAVSEAEEHRLPLERTLEIATAVSEALTFVHAGNLVHRDLKPGNVLLGEDGTAKLGDFGLAAALDRTRLTQDSMVIGTAAYMPPEQALGVEVTPQSDLYSLGAMLYEMVTGRTPFVGDDLTSVISQHINTPPVAPSWHTEHCPPDLEELILHLLQKAPDDRPASASEVVDALSRVDPARRSTSHSDSGTNPLDRLARWVFVGREQELERLHSAFDDAFAGRGSVVMLVGEPGIGKTRTAQELETYARIRGALTLWGRARETAGAPPYHPWIQVGGAYGQTNDVGAFRVAELGPNASELARLFPQLPQLIPGLHPPGPTADPDSARFLLFVALPVGSAKARATATRPTSIDGPPKPPCCIASTNAITD